MASSVVAIFNRIISVSIVSQIHSEANTSVTRNRLINGDYIIYVSLLQKYRSECNAFTVCDLPILPFKFDIIRNYLIVTITGALVSVG